MPEGEPLVYAVDDDAEIREVLAELSYVPRVTCLRVRTFVDRRENGEFPRKKRKKR